jgi:flagellar hook-basal body complex protein FliE
VADLRITPAGAGTRAITPVRFPELRPEPESFGSALGRAVGDVDALQQKAQDTAIAMASGNGQDTARGVAAIEKANIAFQFTLAVRNKLLEAYQEVMRMTV